jgi:uracil-DNA glycosylase family 4
MDNEPEEPVESWRLPMGAAPTRRRDMADEKFESQMPKGGCDVAVVDHAPENGAKPWTGDRYKLLNDALRRGGLDTGRVALIYAVRRKLYEDRAPSAAELAEFRGQLLCDIEVSGAKVVLALGAKAGHAVAGTGYPMSDYRGVSVPGREGCKAGVVMTYHPDYIGRNPQYKSHFFGDVRAALDFARGEAAELRHVTYDLVEPGELRDYLSETRPQGFVALDCEWEGKAPEFPRAHLRLVQLNWRKGRNAVVRVATCEQSVAVAAGDEDAFAQVQANCRLAAAELKEWAEARSVRFAGHNIRSDGHWLKFYGFDLRGKVVFDTMLAEHLIDNTMTFGLEELALRYTKFGRYDLPVLQFRKDNPELVSRGFGRIPDELLLPYSATDVEVVREIAGKQLTALAPFCAPTACGKSLFEIVMRTDDDLYELEDAGLPIDLERLESLISTYDVKCKSLVADFKSALESVMPAEAAASFNHRSPAQVRKLMFDTLKLTPLESTAKPKPKPWDWVMRQTPEVRANFSPSTGKKTMQVLKGEHELVKRLHDIRKVDQVCKSFLKDDEPDEEGGGGIKGCLWPDNRVHSRFSQLTDTGRMRTSNPNCQNFSKQAEKELACIFGKEAKVPGLRSVMAAPAGWTVVEADYKQAELFVLAGLSGDAVMMGALMTPGKDLHDITTIESFDFTVVEPDGSLYCPVRAEEIARRSKTEFEEWKSKLNYIDSKGKSLSRKEFDSGPRIAGKSVSFGIPYGRGASAIATQIWAETGNRVSKQEIEHVIAQWKRTYAKAWGYLSLQQTLAETQGFVATPWGRIRRFPYTKDESVMAGRKREASNFNIQSVVADTMRIAMSKVIDERNARGLRFQVINQIHDATIILVPDEELEQAKSVLEEAMTTVAIPTPAGPLTLSVDMAAFKRWGEK